ncbi:MAG: cation:proton antiporter [Nanoarchaeota archaeon]|nr:cation:proton antiporter [Nanoarchaeota archaeon]
MVVEPFSLLALFSATIVLGYLGSLIFEKTRIPDLIWLLLLGLIIGPGLNLVQVSLFISILPLMAALALLIILFDAGLNMDFYQVVRHVPRSSLLAILHVGASMLFVGAFATFLLGIDPLEGLLLGAILGGTSSAIVISLTTKLHIQERVKTLLNLESIISDPLTIVIPIALIGIITQVNTVSPLASVVAAFSIGAVIGLVAGVGWLLILERLKGRQFDYMLTLAALFMIYAFVEASSGSGAIAALAFGIVLGNGRAFTTMLRLDKRIEVNHLFRTFQAEVSFFIRSFFFVFLGIIATITPVYFLYGLALAAIMIVLRFLVVHVSTLKMRLPKKERNLMRIMIPRGLAAAVLSQLPRTIEGFPNATLYSDVVFTVILATTIYTTIAIKFLSRWDLPKKEENKTEVEATKAENELKKIEKQQKREEEERKKEVKRNVVLPQRQKSRRGRQVRSK